MSAAEGTRLGGGRYRLERRLGIGGMASVWLAHDERLARPVAVKVVADALAGDEQWLARFEREARAAARLSHPNIVKVFDYGVDDGHPFLVMEYVPGITLSARIEQGGLRDDDVRRLARELLEAVAAVHTAAILHRDIKPANVLVDERGRACLTDFGIAQPQGGPSLTQTGMVIGTLRYLAPEVAAGHPATAASDLYSAGVVIGELAGERPTPSLSVLITALTSHEARLRPASADAALQLLDPASAPRSATDATTVMPNRAAASVTAVTRALSPSARFAAAGARLRRHNISPTAVRRGVAALVALSVVIALVIAASADNTPSPRRVRQPASQNAPVDQQLRTLDRIVDDASKT